jgi:undecaprenyl-diphosphatase
MLSKMRIMAYPVLIVVILLAVGSAGHGDTMTTLASEEEKAAGSLTLGKAAVLGIVEGLTEYLPVSSTGHLLLAGRMMGVYGSSSAPEPEQERAKSAADAYAICIQAGAILAVLGLYWARVRGMLSGLVGKDPAGLKMLINIAAGFLPAAVIGLQINGLIKTYLFGAWPVVAAWLAGGLAILAVARWQNGRAHNPHGGKSLDEMGVRMALIIGMAQCIAMWPGVSRSLVTIVGGLMVGLTLPAAVEYSFLLGVVTLGAATGYDALKHGRDMLMTFDLASIAAGLVFAFLFAVLSVKWMVAYLNRSGLALFGYYRIAVAAVASILLMTGKL